MTTYNQLAGLRVNYLGSDPTLNTGNEGQVWYNSTSGTLKSLVQIKSWSSGGNMGTARYSLGGAGTQTAGLAFGGANDPAPAHIASTEEYNGSTWSPPSDRRYLHPFTRRPFRRSSWGHLTSRS